MVHMGNYLGVFLFSRLPGILFLSFLFLLFFFSSSGMDRNWNGIELVGMYMMEQDGMGDVEY